MNRFLRSNLILSLAALLMIAAAIGIPLSSTRFAFAAFSLDPTFGNGGKVITTFGNDASILTAALQTDGKLVAGGLVSNGNHFNCELGRYNTDGSLDASFGSNGTVTKDYGMNCVISSVSIQSDGKILATEEPYSPGFYWNLVRYNTDGSVDTTFGNNGIVSTTMISSVWNVPYSIAIQPADQKIIVVGQSAASNGTGAELAVVRYNPDGSLDNTFGSGGETITTIAGSGFAAGHSVTLQSDGKILVTGEFSYGGPGTLFTARFNTDGNFDSGFGSNGYVTDFGNERPSGQVIISQTDGKIVVAGAIAGSAYLIRYNSDGSHDTGFGSGGFLLNAITASGPSPSDITSLTKDSDGKILFGGNNSTDAVVGRLNTDGSFDTSFGNNGLIITPLGVSSQFSSIVLQTDGKMLAAGHTFNGNYSDWALVRYADTTNQNQPPSINALSNVTINEGDTYSANGSFTDPDSTSWTATVDYGDGSGTQPLILSGTNFSLSHVYSDHGTYTVTVNVTDNQGATGTGTATVTVQHQLVSLASAKVWIGLKNSDDVGIKFDLLAEVYKDSTLVTSGELDSVAGGSSGFNNAKLNTIAFNTFSPVDFPSGSSLKIEVYVRNACTGSTKNSGTARLWFNDSAANSQFGATIGTSTSDYFLLDNFLLGTSVGTVKNTIDIAAGAKCSAFKPFGTWTITP